MQAPLISNLSEERIAPVLALPRAFALGSHSYFVEVT